MGETTLIAWRRCLLSFSCVCFVLNEAGYLSCGCPIRFEDDQHCVPRLIAALGLQISAFSKKTLRSKNTASQSRVHLFRRCICHLISYFLDATKKHLYKRLGPSVRRTRVIFERQIWSFLRVKSH